MDISNKKLPVLFTITLMVFGLSTFAIGGTASLPSGLVSGWDGDSVSGTTAYDIQDGNNGKLMNGATIATGRNGQAFSLDGVDDYIEIADSANLRPTTAITVATWVKLNSAPDGIAVHIVDRNSSEGGKAYEGYLIGANDQGPVFYIWTNPSNPTAAYLTGTNNIWDNQFHHIAGTYDGSVAKLYLDGVLVNSMSASGSIVYATTLNLWIGMNQQPSPYSRQVKGLVDEIQIYNRALSEDEIKNLVNDDDECYTAADLEAARQEGISQCQKDPSSCGITPGGGEAATLSEDLSLLHIPLVYYQTLFGNIPCWLDMTYAPIDNRVLFEVTNFGLIE